jgi:hypothetical protein
LFVKKHPLARYVTCAHWPLRSIAQLSVLPLSLFYFHQFPLLVLAEQLGACSLSRARYHHVGRGVCGSEFFSPLQIGFSLLADALSFGAINGW